ncbi:unnamed protein product [Pneumocystis jirovecii]|uniref:STEEP1 domain-containing protein n=1 Tax=Pneumocystis jirovecii TaxID=42068 RepID=L0P965_PNEJI|nr:unnamed protein product [Pneumocystis jirovecii]
MKEAISKDFNSYFCLCGEYSLSISSNLKNLPKRQHDDALVIDKTRHTFRIKFIKQPEPIILEREDGYEKRWMYNCRRCEVWLAYELPGIETAKNGRVRTKTVKRASCLIIEKYYPRLTNDFHTNKRICDDIAIICSKKLRNKIAGYTTHLMKRIQKGPVCGISFKLQEEERERKDQYVPEVSALTNINVLEVDADTKSMLKSLGYDSVSVTVNTALAGSVEQRAFRNQRRL